jgi:hypothetical protein
MALLFCAVMGGGYANRFLAVWHAIKSDRTQRNVLIAAVKSDTNRPASDSRHNVLIAEIQWVCGQANTLEDLRNDALHSALFGPAEIEGKVSVIASTGLGHVRAKKLEGKDLLVEFRRFRDTADTLSNYVMAIDQALQNGQTLPERPKLPPRAGTKVQKQRRQAQTAKPVRQRPPSQA